MIRAVVTLDQLLGMEPDAAAALMAVRRSDGRTDQDEAVLAAWLRADDAHTVAWDRTRTMWRAFDDAGDDELLGAMRQAASAAGPLQTPPAWWLGAAAAAVLVLMIIAGGVWTLMPGRLGEHLSPRSAGEPAGVVRVYASGDAPLTQVALADGSHVTLDAFSRIEVRMAGDRRAIRLSAGHALFNVAHDTRRPFIVSAGLQTITALGTTFDVRLERHRIRVSLLDGRVAVAAAGSLARPILLRPGEQLDSREGRPPVLGRADTGAVRDWQRGIVTVNDVTIVDVVAMVNRAGPDQITIQDAAIGRLRVTGRLQINNVGRLGRTLAQVHPVRLVQLGAHRFAIVRKQ